MSVITIEATDKDLVKLMLLIRNIEAEEEKVVFKVIRGGFEENSLGLDNEEYCCRFDHDDYWNNSRFKYLGRIDLIEHYHTGEVFSSKREADIYELIDSNPAHYTLFVSCGLKYEGDIEAIENSFCNELSEQIKDFIEAKTVANEKFKSTYSQIQQEEHTYTGYPYER